MTGTNQKSALVLTYHVKRCKRVGGFHHFIRFLEDEGYNVDWVTVPVSITWIFGKGDRENAKNFFSLIRGFSFEEKNVTVRCFSIPLLIPAKIAQRLRMKSGDEFWPDWKRIRKRLKEQYDVVLFEGVACQYAKSLSHEYPNAKLIYRPSDILATFSSVSNPEEREKEAIEYADVCACVDEIQIAFYKHIGADEKKMEILRNPLTSIKDMEDVKNYIPKENEKKTAVYMGVSFCDFEMIEYAAKNNPDCDFYVIGPFDRESHDNVIFTGSMNRKEYEEIFSRANVAIAPTVETEYKAKNGIKYGFTGKIISYMKYLLPIVASCSSNYLGISGFNCVDNKEDFSRKITECLKYTVKERESLREGYMRAMRVFSEEESRIHFSRIIQEKQ